MATTYTPRLGCSIDEVVREMVALADKVGGDVEAKVNDMWLLVTPSKARGAEPTAAEERAAIVAWLRAESAAADARGEEAAPLSQERVRARMIGAALYHTADAIERGKHRP